MSISPKSFGAHQQASTPQPPASQPMLGFGLSSSAGGFGQLSGSTGFGNPAGFGTPGQQASANSMPQPSSMPAPGNTIAGFGSTGSPGQPFPAANYGNPAAFGNVFSSAGVDQQTQLIQAKSVGFGQQAHAGLAGFGQQPQSTQQAGPNIGFGFGQSAAADVRQPSSAAIFQAPQGGMNAGQQAHQHNPLPFASTPAAGQPAFGNHSVCLTNYLQACLVACAFGMGFGSSLAGCTFITGFRSSPAAGQPLMVCALHSQPDMLLCLVGCVSSWGFPQASSSTSKLPLTNQA